MPQTLASILDNSIVLTGALTVLGLSGLWFARAILDTRDTVREIRIVLMDKRTGLVHQVDVHEKRLNTIEDHLGLRRV